MIRQIAPSFVAAALALALPAVAMAQPEDAADVVVRPGGIGATGEVDAIFGERRVAAPVVTRAAQAPRLVLDLDRQPDEGRGFWGTLLRGRPKVAEHTFFDMPFPLDSRRVAGGGPDLEGLPVVRVTTYFRLPREKAFVRKAMKVAEEDSTGFSPSSPIYLRFDGRVNAPPSDPLAATRPDAAVFLVDVDRRSPTFLERRPAFVEVTATGDLLRPANLLQVLPVPGLPLRAGTTYAVVVLRSLGAPGFPRLGQPAALLQALRGQAPAGKHGPAFRDALAPLAAALPSLGVPADEVAAATVFTTGDPSAELRRWVQHVKTLPPPATKGALEVRDAYPDYTALKGVVRLPQTQRGRAPYVVTGLFGGGEIAVGSDGQPRTLRRDDADFRVTVPKGRMPAQGFPLYFYVHGTGGDSDQAIDRGRWATRDTPPPPGTGYAMTVARAGWGTSCVSTLFSPRRIGFLAADGYTAYNFLNPVAFRDNFRQLVLELAHFRNLVLSLRIDPALCPGTDASAAPDGKIRFDPDCVVIAGHSLGSFLSGMLAATVGDCRGVVLTGAASTWVEFAFGPTKPLDLRRLVEKLALSPGERLDRFHPLLSIFDTALGPADNVHHLVHLLRDPVPGASPAPHVLVVQGQHDQQTPANTQRAHLLAVGADLLGPDVGNGPDERVEQVLPWGGLQQHLAPTGGNRLVPGQGPRTALVLRTDADPVLEDKHSVAFQIDAVKERVVRFLEDVRAGRTPVVAPLP